MNSQPRNPGWAFARLGVEALWQRGWRGQGVRVGHLDTGVDASHSALAGRIAEFAQFDRHGHRQASPASDSAAHGTRTGSLICGAEAGGFAVGVAPEAQLISGAVIEGGEAIARVLAGLDWIASSNVRVLALPFGIRCDIPVFRSALRALKRQGVLIITPVGNSGAGQVPAPGQDESVLSVGACDERGRVAPFSGSEMAGPLCRKPEIVAPGVAVLAADSSKTGWASATGTSMAAALTAGVAALLFQAKPRATADEVRSALQQSARPLAPDQEHRARYGIVEPVAALERLLSTAAAAPASQPSEAYSQPVRIDPRLKIGEEAAGERRTRAIVVFHERLEAGADEFAAFAARFVAQLGRDLGTGPAALHLLPRIQTMIVAASTAWLQRAAQHPGVALLGSVDVPRHWASGTLSL